MESAMKGVKRCYDDWGGVFFIYKDEKIKRIKTWYGYQFGNLITYRVDCKDGEFWSLTEAKKYIDRIKK